MSDATARRVKVWRVPALSPREYIEDDPTGTHMLVEVENILKAQRRTDDLRKSFQVLSQHELARHANARDELMRELGLREVQGE